MVGRRSLESDISELRNVLAPGLASFLIWWLRIRRPVWRLAPGLASFLDLVAKDTAPGLASGARFGVVS